MKDQKRGIHELYAENPEAADEIVWGRKVDPVTRRGFLTKGGMKMRPYHIGTIDFVNRNNVGVFRYCHENFTDGLYLVCLIRISTRLFTHL